MLPVFILGTRCLGPDMFTIIYCQYAGCEFDRIETSTLHLCSQCDLRRSRIKLCTSNLGGRQINWFGVTSSSADLVTSPRHEEDLRMKEQAQQAKESWHTRIHRHPTETELHRKVAGKTAQSIVEAALNRYDFFASATFIITRKQNTTMLPVWV